jgi:hypothetical protein
MLSADRHRIFIPLSPVVRTGVVACAAPLALAAPVVARALAGPDPATGAVADGCRAQGVRHRDTDQRIRLHAGVDVYAPRGSAPRLLAFAREYD